MIDDEVEYEPTSVKEVLGEMKDIAELLIDLAYSSVLFEDPGLAEEVLELESEMDVLQLQARMSLVMAGRNPQEAEQLAPIFGIVGAAEKISDAAGDIAKVALEDIGVPAALYASLPEAVDTLARVSVTSDSTYANQTLGEINLETLTGVRVIAIRRDDEWILNPDKTTPIRPNDVVFGRGPEAAVANVHESLADSAYEQPEAAPSSIDDLERAVESIVLMKNMSELAVDLAYGSVLLDSPTLAEEVSNLEVEIDALKARFEAWALRAAASVDDPVSIRGLLHIATSTEVISDAALEISEGVLRGLGSHPVVQTAVEESEEVLTSVSVIPGGDLDGRPIADLQDHADTAVKVVAIRRESETSETGTEWLLSPPSDTVLRPNDTLIIKGTRTGTDRLETLAS